MTIVEKLIRTPIAGEIHLSEQVQNSPRCLTVIEDLYGQNPWVTYLRTAGVIIVKRPGNLTILPEHKEHSRRNKLLIQVSRTLKSSLKRELTS